MARCENFRHSAWEYSAQWDILQVVGNSRLKHYVILSRTQNLYVGRTLDLVGLI